jgi:hypothetical protein
MSQLIIQFKTFQKFNSTPNLNDAKIDEEFDFDKKKVIKDKYKTTDIVNINFNFVTKVNKIESQKMLVKSNFIFYNQDRDREFDSSLKHENLIKENYKSIDESLKDDLKNLTWAITRKQTMDEAPALLMVINFS